MRPRVAVACFHSHADRSFLDDRILALVAGDLREAGVDAELVVAVLEDDARLDALVEALRGFDVVVYERVWSRDVVARLVDALPDAVFVSCEGEHVLDDPPAGFVCAGDLRATVPALVAHLAGDGPLPRGVRARDGEVWREGLGKVGESARRFAPVLRPVVVGPDTWAARRTFSIEGNAGCPYGADARDNPLYAGASIPDEWGRGCAFCTTGNRSESAPLDVTADKVMAQLRYVRREAPSLRTLVLKDQNPFGWLTEVVERCAAEGLGGFSLLLETRADWWMRNRARFERALEVADRVDLRLCPFLVGIESFSQPSSTGSTRAPPRRPTRRSSRSSLRGTRRIRRWISATPRSGSCCSRRGRPARICGPTSRRSSAQASTGSAATSWCPRRGCTRTPRCTTWPTATGCSPRRTPATARTTRDATATSPRRRGASRTTTWRGSPSSRPSGPPARGATTRCGSGGRSSTRWTTPPTRPR